MIKIVRKFNPTDVIFKSLDHDIEYYFDSLRSCVIVLMTLLIISCNSQEMAIINLDETPIKLEVFSPEIISTGMYERDMAISPNGDELIYTLSNYKQTKRCLVSMTKVNNKWTNPKMLNISGEFQDIEPFYYDNGNSLYFASDRPIDSDLKRKDYNIWVSKRESKGWTSPVALNENINTENDEFYPSLSRNGNLYFTSTRKNGVGREDIFVSKFGAGKYQEAEVLDTMINTQFYEFNAYINPDEDLLIFSSYGRDDDMGGGDLYYSNKNADGKWSPSQNMGSKINSSKLDYCPFIDVERNNFYFTSDRANEQPIIFLNIEKFTKASNSEQNGMGDIYRIGIEELGL